MKEQKECNSTLLLQLIIGLGGAAKKTVQQLCTLSPASASSSRLAVCNSTGQEHLHDGLRMQKSSNLGAWSSFATAHGWAW